MSPRDLGSVMLERNRVLDPVDVVGELEMNKKPWFCPMGQVHLWAVLQRSPWSGIFLSCPEGSSAPPQARATE